MSTDIPKAVEVNEKGFGKDESFTYDLNKINNPEIQLAVMTQINRQNTLLDKALDVSMFGDDGEKSINKEEKEECLKNATILANEYNKSISLAVAEYEENYYLNEEELNKILDNAGLNVENITNIANSNNYGLNNLIEYGSGKKTDERVSKALDQAGV